MENPNNINLLNIDLLNFFTFPIKNLRVKEISKIFIQIFNYNFIEKVTENVFLLEILKNNNKTLAILKIQKYDHNPLIKNKINISEPHERSLKMIKLFNETKLSPLIYLSFIYKNHLILLSEYISNAFNEYSFSDKILIKNIENKINDMHNMEIIHGDLHEGNIRYTDNKEVYFVDVDTAFTIKEYHELNFPKEWIIKGFSDINNLEEFLEYEKVQFKFCC